MQNERKYFTYILFDYFGTPRYVGKGSGYRDHKHAYYDDPRNLMKAQFIKETLAVLGEVPKIRVREGLTEEEAFNLEIELISSIGRYPNGPLTNMTDGGDGVRVSLERRREITQKAGRAPWINLTPEERSERIRQMHAARTTEERSELARQRWKRLPESRRQLSQSLRIAAAQKTKEERSEQTRCAREAVGPEQHAKRVATVGRGYFVALGNAGGAANAARGHAALAVSARKAWQLRRMKLTGSVVGLGLNLEAA